jgi:polar amino acid transport system substrate-binding protein
MFKAALCLLLGLGLLLGSVPKRAAALDTSSAPLTDMQRPIHFASLYWPPYVGKNLPFGGTDAKILRDAFAAEGLKVVIDYVPWPRALALFESGRVDGVFPEYPEGEQSYRSCALSRPYKLTQLSIAESSFAPLTWNTVADLTRYRLGVVRGYLNTPDFDALVANGLMTVEAETSDVINLRKVAGQRIDGALIDPEVYRYLAETDVSLQPLLHLIQLNPKPLAERTLHVCFSKTPRGKALRDIFHHRLDAIGIAPNGQKISLGASQHSE